MRIKTGIMNKKLIVLLLSGALFVTGVMALSWEPGRPRTTTLAFVLLAMLCIAVRQTLQRIRQNRKK